MSNSCNRVAATSANATIMLATFTAVPSASICASLSLSFSLSLSLSLSLCLFVSLSIYQSINLSLLGIVALRGQILGTEHVI